MKYKSERVFFVRRRMNGINILDNEQAEAIVKTIHPITIKEESSLMHFTYFSLDEKYKALLGIIVGVIYHNLLAFFWIFYPNFTILLSVS
jgi:hypothetical protein